MMRIPLADIVTDGGTQVRVQPDEATVADYAQHMTDGAQFPAIVLFHDGNQYFLADGFHRVLAARRNDWRDIDADVRVGTKTDALWFALAANKANGRRLTEADKTHAVRLALIQWPEKLQREIAEQVGCSESLVSKASLQIGKTTGVAGDLRGRALAIKNKRDEIRELVKAGVPSVEIRQRLKAHSTTIAEVRRELGRNAIDTSRAAIAQRSKDIADMAARGFSTRQIAEAIGIGTDRVTHIAKKEGVVIHADRVVAGSRRIDPNRVVEQTVMDAENLTADVDLVAFDELDPAKLGAWIDSLKKSQRALGEFVRRLIKEQIKHGQAA